MKLLHRSGERELLTEGTVTAVKTQWWLKVNTKPVRRHSMDGAVFPHIIHVRYRVGDREYTCRKWVRAGQRPPEAGSTVTVCCPEDRPGRGRVL